MKVSLIVKPDSNVTGLSRYSGSLVSELRADGIDVRVDSPVTQMPQAMVRLGQKLGWDLAAFSQTYPIRARLPEADVYHLASETLATLQVLPGARPTVVTVHAFFSYLLRDDATLALPEPRVRRLFDVLAAQGLRRAQAVIAVSEYIKAALIEKVGVREDRIRVVHEAVDHAEFHPQPVSEAFYERQGLLRDAKYILYVGSEQPRKNFLTLLRAFARLRAEYEDVRLLKVGQPEVQSERERAEKLIAELGLGSAVLFRPHAGSDLSQFYNLCHIFVFPSHYEGFGFPPLEAMACGAAVVCSNSTSLPEVTGDAALLFDPADEDALVDRMRRLIADNGLRNEYSQRGLARARQFNWGTTARRTVDVYHEVIAARRKYVAQVEEI